MDFYGTTAQVIPVLLLAITWESGYLTSLKADQARAQRPIWTKPVIRAWALFMTAAAVVGEAAMLLVLADVVDDGAIPKALGLGAIGALLGTLSTRLGTDIFEATKE